MAIGSDKNKKRILELDIVKGFGIILIAVYHIVYRSMDGIADNVIRSLGWGFIGIYFLLSGYTCRKGSGVFESYKRRVMGLLLPVFLAEILLLAFGGLYFVLFHGYSARDILHDAAVTFLRPEITTHISSRWGEGGLLFFNLSPVWFIWSMLWTELFFHPLRKLLVGKGELKWALMLVLLLGIQVPMYLFLDPAPWELTIVPTFLIFMMFGAKLREWDAVNRLKKVKPLPAFGITVACLAAHFGLFFLNGNESYYVSIFGNHGAWDVFTVQLQLLLIFPAMFFLARAITKVGILAKGLGWMGRHTMYLLILHCIVTLVYSDILNIPCKLGDYWYLEPLGIEVSFEIVGKSLLACVLGLLTCVPIIMLWEVLEKLLFGRRLRKPDAEKAEQEKQNT